MKESLLWRRWRSIIHKPSPQYRNIGWHITPTVKNCFFAVRIEMDEKRLGNFGAPLAKIMIVHRFFFPFFFSKVKVRVQRCKSHVHSNDTTQTHGIVLYTTHWIFDGIRCLYISYIVLVVNVNVVQLECTSVGIASSSCGISHDFPSNSS